MRAARALNAHASTSHGANIALTKHVPARAGLGGGSADAAATLTALNDLWHLGLSLRDLCAIGLTLGADVPFCLMGGAKRARGLGETLDPIVIPHTYELVILHPGGGLSTPEMFRAWDGESAHTQPANIKAGIAALQARDFSALNASTRNMLQACATRAMPEIGQALQSLSAAGAQFTSMTGSGSAVFGAFETATEADAAAKTIGPTAIRAHTL